MVQFLPSVTFACGLLVACAHVVNRCFVSPVYNVVANRTTTPAPRRLRSCCLTIYGREAALGADRSLVA